METKPAGAWRFWAGWGLAFIGFPLGGLAARALVGGVGSTAEGVIAGVATGTVVGAAQWLVLSRRLPLSPWWIGATSAGMAVGLGTGIQLLGTDMAGEGIVLRGLITGAGIGLAQALVLRGVTGGAAAWGAAVTLGWALGWLTSRAAGVDLAAWSVFGSTGAWVFQIVTGLALAWLLRRAPVMSSHLAPVV